MVERKCVRVVEEKVVEEKVVEEKAWEWRFEKKGGGNHHYFLYGKEINNTTASRPAPSSLALVLPIPAILTPLVIDSATRSYQCTSSVLWPITWHSTEQRLSTVVHGAHRAII